MFFGFGEPGLEVRASDLQVREVGPFLGVGLSGREGYDLVAHRLGVQAYLVGCLAVVHQFLQHCGQGGHLVLRYALSQLEKGIGFSNAPFPSPRHPEYGRTGAAHSARRA